jgi:hypothetical protein
MNIGRIILGGVIAGIVANAGDYLINVYLMADEGTAMVQRLNLSAAAVEGSLVTWIVVDIILGLLLVFTYAGFRPRFGPGPRTAIIAGVTIWLAICAVFAGLMSMGIYTQQAYLKSSVLTLANTVIASLAGAYFYRE